MSRPKNPSAIRAQGRSVAHRRSPPSTRQKPPPATEAKPVSAVPCYHVENWKVRGVDHPAIADD